MPAFVQRLRATARTLARREDGAAALEFAMVVGPFLFMLFALLEIAVVYVISLSLDNAAMDVSRRIRTGEMQNAGGATAETFRDEICSRMFLPQASCRTALRVDVRTFEQWKDAPADGPVADGEFKDDDLMFDPGGPKSIVLIRGYYKWRLITPFLTRAVNRMNDGTGLISTTISFRNEPY